MASPRQTAAHPTVLFARIEEDPPLGVAMGLDFTTVQRMFGASLVASVGVFILQGSMMDAVLTLIALCALSAMIWGLSERSETFSALRLTGSGPWESLAVVVSIVAFAQISIAVWAFPAVGAYILSLSFLGSFWVTGYMMQPNGV